MSNIINYKDTYDNIYKLNIKLSNTFNSLLQFNTKLLGKYYFIIFRNHIITNKYKLSKYASIIGLFYILNRIRYYYGINSIPQLLLNIPIISGKIKLKLKETSMTIEKGFDNNYTNYIELPNNSSSEDNLQKKIITMTNSSNLIKNKVGGAIYIDDEKHNDKLLKIFKQFSYSNPLHCDIYPQIIQMEIDIINICKKLYKGTEQCCGNVTYGGTESLLLCCLAYRDYYYDRGIKNPNIIVPETIHPAVDKACHYFNIKLVKIPLYKNSGTINANNIRNYINSNTILLIGSAPCYSYGIIDPLIKMGEIAHKYGIGFHIDCCMGGFLLPFIDEFKYINFNLKGVTSISMDIHKYGYSFKGSSVILYNKFNLKKYQHTINSKWNGGVYATPTIMGTKSGGLIACAWASLLYIGKNNFTKYSNEIIYMTNYIKNTCINDTNRAYITIIGNPILNIIAFKSNNDSLNIYQVVEQMKTKKWKLSILQNPPSFHYCITKNHNIEIIKEFCNDLNESIDYSINNNNSKLSGTLAFYGGTQNIENNLFIDYAINDYVFLQSTNKINHIYNL